MGNPFQLTSSIRATLSWLKKQCYELVSLLGFVFFLMLEASFQGMVLN